MNDRTAKDVGCVNKAIQLVGISMDVSGSMSGEYIRAENEALRYFFEEGSKGGYGNRTMVSRIKFSDEAEVADDWMLLSEADPHLSEETGTCTNMDAGVNLALEKIAEKESELARNGTPHGASLLVLITDGMPTSSIDGSVARIKQRLSERDRNGNAKFIFLPIYVGSGSVPEDLLMYTGKAYTANNGSDTSGKYHEIFNFLFNSIKALHDSADGGGKANVPLGDMQVVTLN